jgi:hypothetical protein
MLSRLRRDLRQQQRPQRQRQHLRRAMSVCWRRLERFLRCSPRRRRQSCKDRGDAASTPFAGRGGVQSSAGGKHNGHGGNDGGVYARQHAAVRLAMHEAASHLAGEATKLQLSSELKPALGLLHKSREDTRPAMPLID